MKEFHNRNPLRRRPDETILEQDNPTFVGRRRSFLRVFRGFLFLFVLVCLLYGVVWHYSRFSTGGKFLLKTEDSGVLSDRQEEREYQRLLLRNRFPFDLTVTVQLCRKDGDPALPRFFVFDERQYRFTGTRSLYSGSYETRVSIVVSGDGRFHVTDRSGKPEDLLDMAALDAKPLEQNGGAVDARLHAALVKAMLENKLSRIGNIREDQLTYGKAVTRYCSLPGGPPDTFLVLTLTPKANYRR